MGLSTAQVQYSTRMHIDDKAKKRRERIGTSRDLGGVHSIKSVRF